MKIQQLSLPLETPLHFASSVKCGDLFLFKNYLYMRVKPVSWMLNSQLIQDKLAQGFIVAVWMETGKLGFMKGNEPIEPVTATLQWSK